MDLVSTASLWLQSPPADFYLYIFQLTDFLFFTAVAFHLACINISIDSVVGYRCWKVCCVFQQSQELGEDSWKQGSLSRRAGRGWRRSFNHQHGRCLPPFSHGGAFYLSVKYLSNPCDLLLALWERTFICINFIAVNSSSVN